MQLIRSQKLKQMKKGIGLFVGAIMWVMEWLRGLRQQKKDAGSIYSLAPATTMTTSYGLVSSDLASLNIASFALYAECRPLFDFPESAIRTLAEFTLLFSDAGLALVVGPENFVILAQSANVLDIDEAYRLLSKHEAGWQRADGLIWNRHGSPGRTTAVINATAYEAIAVSEPAQLAA